MKKINVNYIKWKRNDAIGKATSMYLNNLTNKINLNVIELVMINNRYKISSYVRLLKNIFKLSKSLLSNKITHFEEPEIIESSLISIFKNKKSVLTVHHLKKKKSKFDLSFLISKWEHSSFAKLIAISENTKQDLIKMYEMNPDKIEVVYHGVDKKIFKPTKQKIKLLKNKKYLLYLGSENYRKNIKNLLKAFKIISKKYPNLILVKAGYHGGKNYRKETLKLIKRYKLTKKVKIVSEYLREKDLPLYYSNAELFVYPTLQEGFGMPLVESMACGCPVVTSNIAPMNEIAKGQVLVNPYNSKDIAKGIDEILSNKKYKKELITRAIKRAKNFDWKKSAEKILRVYKELNKKVYNKELLENLNEK